MTNVTMCKLDEETKCVSSENARFQLQQENNQPKEEKIILLQDDLKQAMINPE